MNNTLRTTLYLTGLTLFFLIVGQILGGINGLIIAFFFAAIMNFGMYYYSDKIVLSMHSAKKSNNKQLNEIVSEVARKVGIPKPKVYVINQNTMNAFATGRNPKNAAIAVTPMLLNNLTKNELRAVIGHELTHIKNRDTLISTLAATMAGAITMLTRVAWFAGMFGSRDRDNSLGETLAWLTMLILAPIIAVIINLAVSRSREYLADQGGARITNKKDMISALESISHSPKLKQGVQGASHLYISNPFANTNITELFSTHPPLYKRIQNLEKA